jgi:hypothetical protein
MNTQALLIETLLAGFFAIACFRARSQSHDIRGVAPRKLFVLLDRLQRLRMTRWQWCSMVLLLVVTRYQHGQPLIAEFTALAQFILFLALPSAKVTAQSDAKHGPLREALRRS